MKAFQAYCNQFSNPWWCAVFFFWSHRWLTTYRDHMKVFWEEVLVVYTEAHLLVLRKQTNKNDNNHNNNKNQEKKRRERAQWQHNTGRKELNDCLKHALFSLMWTDAWTQVTQILLEKVYTLFFCSLLLPCAIDVARDYFYHFITDGDPYIFFFLVFISTYRLKCMQYQRGVQSSHIF